MENSKDVVIEICTESVHGLPFTIYHSFLNHLDQRSSAVTGRKI